MGSYFADATTSFLFDEAGDYLCQFPKFRRFKLTIIHDSYNIRRTSLGGVERFSELFDIGMGQSRNEKRVEVTTDHVRRGQLPQEVLKYAASIPADFVHLGIKAMTMFTK